MKKTLFIALPFFLLFAPLCVKTVYGGDSTDIISTIDQDGVQTEDSVVKKVIPFQIFGKNSNTGKWKTFKSQKEITAFCENKCFDFADVYFQGPTPVLTICEFTNPTGDRVLHVSYYFRTDGSLEKLKSDLSCSDAILADDAGDSFLLKVSRTKYYGTDGQCIKETDPQYFDITTQRPIQGEVHYLDIPCPLFLHIQEAPFYAFLNPALAQTGQPCKGPRKLVVHLGFSYGDPKTIKQQLRDSINQIRDFADKNHIQLSDDNTDSTKAYTLHCGEDATEIDSVETGAELKNTCEDFFSQETPIGKSRGKNSSPNLF